MCDQNSKIASLGRFLGPVVQGAAAGAQAAPGPTTGLAAPGFGLQFFRGLGAGLQQQQQQALLRNELERQRKADAMKEVQANIAFEQAKEAARQRTIENQRATEAGQRAERALRIQEEQNQLGKIQPFYSPEAGANVLGRLGSEGLTPLTQEVTSTVAPPSARPSVANLSTGGMGLPLQAPAATLTQQAPILAPLPPTAFKPETGDFDQLYAQYLKDNNLKDTAASRIAARKLWTNAGREPKDTSVSDNARIDRSFQYNASRIDKARTPIEAQAERIARLSASIDQRTPQSDALIAPELLTAMAGGMGSGLRMNEAEIARIVGGRSNWETLRAKLNKWAVDPKEALTVTDAQRTQIRALVDVTQQRINNELAAIDEAEQSLAASNSVVEHRAILNRLHKRLAEVNTPAKSIKVKPDEVKPLP